MGGDCAGTGLRLERAQRRRADELPANPTLRKRLGAVEFAMRAGGTVIVLLPMVATRASCACVVSRRHGPPRGCGSDVDTASRPGPVLRLLAQRVPVPGIESGTRSPA